MNTRLAYLAGKRIKARDALARAFDRHQRRALLRRDYVRATSALLEEELRIARPKTAAKPSASPDLFNF